MKNHKLIQVTEVNEKSQILLIVGLEKQQEIVNFAAAERKIVN